MSNERDKGIDLLLNILKGQQYEQISGMSSYSDKIIQLADMHRVSYSLLLFAQNHPGIFTARQMERLSGRCRKNAMQSLAQLHELIRVNERLSEAGILVVAVKGPQLAHMIYRHEAFKESVDLDLMLVRESDLNRAQEQLAGLGYSQSELNSHQGRMSRRIFLIAKREVHYYNPGKDCHIDLHTRPGSNAYLTARLFRNFFSHLEMYDLEGNPVQMLPADQYLVYLCYHGGLHQFSRLGWLMDIRAFLSLKRDELDYERVVNRAREIGAERSLFLALRLISIFFGDAIPGKLENRIPRNTRMNYLVRHCLRMLSRDAGYGSTLQGRFSKHLYMMVLIKGAAGRIDMLIGTIMRVLAVWTQRKSPVP